MGMITGVCFCKAVQYELLTESQMQGLCYCTDCQVLGGSSHWASYAVAPFDFRLLEGTLTAYTYFGASAPRWCEVDPRLTAFGNTE